ncbi:class I SAM-dependent methyltransferase [Paractinoplanes durhamensis]|uniref:Methyltransferase n=1 Tax=Paractinoplanes durhamensis TaxID=113563 RepID=A0ABQ3YXK9_9ACTN|nr:methyltransferase domain-containing protein [Actinoplanes durhamensis]GIE02314.1 methyltransferase [Actinoplanes durhamensis]
MAGDVWAVGAAYEAYVGRWSRPVAAEFVRWLAVPPGARWLDAGCGTGALTGAIFAAAAPALVVGADMSLGFLREPRAGTVLNADAAALPLAADAFGAVVSGLALNFVPHPEQAVTEFARVAAPGATVASYVWDYADGMQLMRWFWDAARAVDPAAAAEDEAVRFPICNPAGLAAAWTAAGLDDVETRPITVPTVFTDFDDYWQPFLGGQGAAPAYLSRLVPNRRWEIRDLLDARLPRRPDGSIALTATAWAIRGRTPG